MIYHGTNMTETIWFGPQNDADDVHCIELIKDCDSPVFHVTTCCNTDWVWTFYMDGESNYEMVKHTIIDTMFQYENMVEFLDELDFIFSEDFADIIAFEEDECCCEHCDGRDCLN